MQNSTEYREIPEKVLYGIPKKYQYYNMRYEHEHEHVCTYLYIFMYTNLDLHFINSLIE